MSAVTFRKPTLADAPGITKLVFNSKPLDKNSEYSYLLLCHHFRDTCVVAELDSKIVGFLSAYRPPVSETHREDNVIFVWQVTVAASAQGKGVATGLLQELLKRKACSGVSYLETTITPSNKASQALFQSLASSLETECTEEVLFPEELFVRDEDHEAEVLFRIGPFHL